MVIHIIVGRPINYNDLFTSPCNCTVHISSLYYYILVNVLVIPLHTLVPQLTSSTPPLAGYNHVLTTFRLLPLLYLHSATHRGIIVSVLVTDN